MDQPISDFIDTDSFGQAATYTPSGGGPASITKFLIMNFFYQQLLEVVLKIQIHRHFVKQQMFQLLQMEQRWSQIQSHIMLSVYNRMELDLQN